MLPNYSVSFDPFRLGGEGCKNPSIIMEKVLNETYLNETRENNGQEVSESESEPEYENVKESEIQEIKTTEIYKKEIHEQKLTPTESLVPPSAPATETDIWQPAAAAAAAAVRVSTIPLPQQLCLPPLHLQQPLLPHQLSLSPSLHPLHLQESPPPK